jgi:hypothetical protein
MNSQLLQSFFFIFSDITALALGEALQKNQQLSSFVATRARSYHSSAVQSALPAFSVFFPPF